MRVFTSELHRLADPDERLFGWIKAGPFGLSIQASRKNYSCPRRDGLEPDEYACFEVLMWELPGEEEISPLEMGVPIPGLENHWHADGPSGSIGNYVPAAMVQALFTWCIMQDEHGVEDELLLLPPESED